MNIKTTPMVKLSENSRTWIICVLVERDGKKEYVHGQYKYEVYDAAVKDAKSLADSLKITFSRNNGYPDVWHAV